MTWSPKEFLSCSPLDFSCYLAVIMPADKHSQRLLVGVGVCLVVFAECAAAGAADDIADNLPADLAP